MPSGNIAPVDVLPPDDGAIDRGLLDLDTRLLAWLAAFRAAASRISVAGAAADSARALNESIVAKANSTSRCSEPRKQAPAHPPDRPGESRERVEVVADPVEPTVAAPTEEELLLASLDPEMRKQVRVRRRMSGNRKSIQQLIEEVKLASSEQEHKPRSSTKRKWW